MWKSSWVLASSHGDFVVHGGDWQLHKPGLMSDRQLYLSAKCWIWTCVELCKLQRRDSSQAPQSWPDSLSSCSYLSSGWHFLHHFLDRKHWSTVEKPGSVSGLDLNELCFAIRARLPEGGHLEHSFHRDLSAPLPGKRVTLVAVETLLLELLSNT